MSNIVDCKATFVSCNIRARHAVLQFELDPDCRHLLGRLSEATGQSIFLTIKMPQEKLFDENEVAEGQVTIDDQIKPVLELPGVIVEDLPDDVVIDDEDPDWLNGNDDAA